MVTDKNGYIQLIEYLTEHLSLFENAPSTEIEDPTSVMAFVEQELAEQISTVCMQNKKLSGNQRNTIISEVDSVLFDLQEILSGVANKPINKEQTEFINEFAMLMKNLFDSEIGQSI